MGIPRSISFILGFALAALPASATITYTACSSGGGCTSSSGSYAGMPGATGATGLAFSSPITFVAAGLNGTTGIFTDTGVGTGGTGTVFTNFNGTTAATGQLISGNFVQSSAFGGGTGIEIDLPPNTFAFAMVVQSCFNGSCSSIPFTLATVGLGTDLSFGTNYGLTIPQGGPAQFFGIVSDSALSSLFLSVGFSNGLLSVNSFEIGQGSGTPDVPEAATFFTMGGGLIGLYFWRRPRLRKPHCLKTSYQWRSVFALRVPLRPQALIERRVVHP